MWDTRDMDTHRESLDEGPVTANRVPSVSAGLRTPSLRRRLLVLVAGSMVPVLLLAATIVLQGYTRAEQAAQERVLQITRSTVAAVDRELQSRIAALEVLALSPTLQSSDLEAFRAEAVRFLSRFPGAGLSLSDRSGRQLLNTNAAPGQVISRRADVGAVETVFATGKPYVSNMYMGRLSKRAIFLIDVPVSRGEEVIYSLAINSPRAAFADILQQLNLPDGWIISIFDREAHHVARLPSRNADQLTSASDSLRSHLATGTNRIVETTSLEGIKTLTAFTRSEETGWIVALGIPIDTISGPARQTLFTTFSVGMLLLLVSLGFASRLATHLMHAEAHRELLINELNHRVKNTLSAVQAIVGRGLADSAVSPEQRNAIEARLLALSHVHNVLSSRNWEGADLRDIATAVFEPFATNGKQRMTILGPSINLRPRIAIALALVLNELVTNAAKYGAFLTPDGIVELTWQMNGALLRLTWRESGGPPVRPPMRAGYGTRFIERAVAGELGGTYVPVYTPEGLSVVIEFAA